MSVNVKNGISIYFFFFFEKKKPYKSKILNKLILKIEDITFLMTWLILKTNIKA